MVRVTVKNNLPFTVQINEGNGGVFMKKALLEPNTGKFTLDLDPNATYREYVLITLPDNTKLPVFSSDDVAEIKAIVIKEVGKDKDGNPKYGWQGVSKDNVPAVPVPAEEPGNDQSLTLFQKAKKFFRIK